ncbi:hypothetical protein Hypma_015955 [Hypsizygus marmoreus]|uniref:Uncharacterized protein n=1 Tax=Hypsizygus marmoreus TaxID=39966 RepID=A0A369K750_HYPMA|nr:hypothetical protein Hypma_015955 [Hypsizygus marmoreus]
MEGRYSSAHFVGPSFNSTDPIPADNPTFTKYGESSHLPETSPVFHPGAEKSYKSMGSPSQARCDEPRHNLSSSAPFSSMRLEQFEEWTQNNEELDMIMSMGSYGEPFVYEPSHQPPHADEWPTWDTLDRLSSTIPISAARSSIECTPPQPDNFGAFFPGSHEQQYDLHDPESPLSPFNDCDVYVAESTHLPYLFPQPHNNPDNSTQSPSSSLPFSSWPGFSASSQRLLPTISTVSPPALSSSSSSSSPSTSSSPELILHTPIPLHHPRPSRHIPIVSISELASACDDTSFTPLKHSIPSHTESQELLSPLSLDSPANYMSTFSPLYPEHVSIANNVEHEDVFQKCATGGYYSLGNGEAMMFCGCGCHQSFGLYEM